jgi:diacylglycerol kinase family enzyme
MNDGILDFCLVKPVNRIQVLKFFPLFKKGEHESMEYVEVLRGTKALFESDTPFPLNIDGEVSLETSASVEILPSSIRVIIPD